MFGNKDNFGPQPNQNGWYASGPRKAPGQRSPGDMSANLYRPRQDTSVSYVPPNSEADAPPPQPQTYKQPETKKQRRIGAGFIAAMLIASLVGGVVGGGTAALYLSGRLTEATPPSAEDVFLPALSQNADAETPEIASHAVLSALDVTYAVEKAADSVVEIALNTSVRTFFGGQREAQNAGSGVILAQNGYIVTNNHVIEDADEIIVRTADGREFPAQVIGADPRTDLAVIKIDETGLAPTVFADSDAVRVGQLAIAIGNPLGALGGTVTHGIVSARDREITIDGQTMTLMQTSAAVNPGNSGGGLFNARGELIGVVNAKGSGIDVEGLGFAIPSNIVRAVTGDLIRHGYVTGRPELGITVVQINNPRDAAHHGMDGTGVFVVEVSRENGLEPRDQILAIDGVEIESFNQVSEAVQARSVGDVMQITVMRQGETLILDVILSEQIPQSIRANLPEPSDM